MKKLRDDLGTDGLVAEMNRAAVESDGATPSRTHAVGVAAGFMFAQRMKGGDPRCLGSPAESLRKAAHAIGQIPGVSPEAVDQFLAAAEVLDALGVKWSEVESQFPLLEAFYRDAETISDIGAITRGASRKRPRRAPKN